MTQKLEDLSFSAPLCPSTLSLPSALIVGFLSYWAVPIWTQLDAGRMRHQPPLVPHDPRQPLSWAPGLALGELTVPLDTCSSREP